MRSSKLLPLAMLTLLGCSAWVDTDALGDPPAGGGSPSSCATGCDDGIDCTQDECVAGSCVHAVNSTLCGAQQACDLKLGCIAECEGSSCMCTGSDCPGGSCTVDPEDKDGDGHNAVVVGQPACGDDCRDDDSYVYGGARELCNGKDDDCDGVADDACVNVPPLCQTVKQLTFNSAGLATEEGTLGEMGARPMTSCGTGSGRGVVYSFEVRALSDIIIDTVGSSFPTLLAVGTDCSSEGGFNLACVAGQPRDSTRSRIVIHRFDPNVQRTLYLVVDAMGPRNSGAFKLSVQVQPAVSYSCGVGGAPLDISPGGKLVGFMSATGSSYGTCMVTPIVFNPAEAVVRYTAAAATRLRCQASSTAFAPGLYAQTACGGLFAQELACMQSNGNNAGRAEINLNLAAGSETFVFVDNGSNGGKYELTCEPQ